MTDLVIKKRKSRAPGNPSGKGGLQERPEDMAKGTPALIEKAIKEREIKKIIYTEMEERVKERRVQLAFQDEHLPVSLKALEGIEGFIKVDRDKGGMSQDQEIETLKSAYFNERLERERLEKRIKELEAGEDKEGVK